MRELLQIVARILETQAEREHARYRLTDSDDPASSAAYENYRLLSELAVLTTYEADQCGK